MEASSTPTIRRLTLSSRHQLSPIALTLGNGTIIEKSDLEGATFAVALPGETKPKQVQITAIVLDSMDPDGEVLLYRMRF